MTKEERKEYYKKYYQKNKDKILAHQKQYNALNKEKKQEYDRNYSSEYRKNNKDKVNEYNRKYRESRKQYYKEYYQEYYQEHKEELLAKGKKWRQKNKDKLNAYRRERRALKGIKQIYSVHNGQFSVPFRYRNKFDKYADIIFVPSGIIIYPHNDNNNDKDNVHCVKISSNNIITIKGLFHRYWEYIPEKIRFEEYKKGLIIIPVEQD